MKCTTRQHRRGEQLTRTLAAGRAGRGDAHRQAFHQSMRAIVALTGASLMGYTVSAMQPAPLHSARPLKVTRVNTGAHQACVPCHPHLRYLFVCVCHRMPHTCRTCANAYTRYPSMQQRKRSVYLYDDVCVAATSWVFYFCLPLADSTCAARCEFPLRHLSAALLPRRSRAATRSII